MLEEASTAMGADPLSGATGALVASSLSGVSAGPVELSNYAAPIAAGITIARGGCAIDMIASANVAMSVKTYNDDLHREPDKLEVKALKEKAEEARKVREERQKYESDIAAVADKIKETYGQEVSLSNEEATKLHNAYLQVSTQNPILDAQDKAKLVVERYEISKLHTGAVEPVYPEAALAVGKIAGWVRGAVGLARAQQTTSTVETQIISREKFAEDVKYALDPKLQPWTVRAGQAYKVKVFGRGQNTGPGHATKSYRIAVSKAKKDTVDEVHLNQGMNKVTKSEPGTYNPNYRHDVTVKNKDGTIDMFEVKSKTDETAILDARMKDSQSKLPKHMQGETKVVDFTKGKVE